MPFCVIDFVIYNIVCECMCLAYSVNYIPVKLMYIMYFLNSLLYIIECVYFSECFRHSFLTVFFNGNYSEIIYISDSIPFHGDCINRNGHIFKYRQLIANDELFLIGSISTFPITENDLDYPDSTMYFTIVTLGRKILTACLLVVEQYWSDGWRGSGHLVCFGNHLRRRLALQKVSYCPFFFYPITNFNIHTLNN